ncbi:phospholipase A2 inhibitor and Ly6/PLAUR domain-containing protein-like [Lithobates pipiens]
MMCLLELFFILAALANTGLSLSCMQCSSTTTSCTGSSVTCSSGNKCGVIYTTTTAGSSTTSSYAMSCLSSDQCSLSGSLTTNDMRLKTAASCCSTDNCIPSLPSLPGDSSVYNGVTCRSCLSASSTWCYTSDTIKCTGNENMCLLQSTEISGSQSLATAIRGCSTQSFCNLGSQSSSANGLSSSIKFVCTSGSSGLRQGFYLPAVICLFFLKLLI